MSMWNLDKIEKGAKIFSLLATPFVLGIGGYFLQNIISQRAADVAYTELAITILKEDADENRNPELRNWATVLLRKTSPVDITEELAKKLKDGTVTFPEFDFFRRYELSGATPLHLLQCVRESTVDIPEGPLSKAETAGLLARLRASELAKSRCAEGWASWFSDLSSER